jgi:glycosyltransferase domain-containing protein
MYNFTLIIPTNNRHDYLIRSINYFKNLDSKVIYCDSSEKSYPGMIYPNMEYLHLPNTNFAEKILIALDKANTNIIALCADDDFIIIDSLYQGYDILANSESIKTILGKNLAFFENFNGYFYSGKTSFLNEINFGAEKNIAAFFSNYQQILWGMYYKQILIDSFKIIKKAQFTNDNFIELTIGAVACYFGGLKFIEGIWSVRELNTNQHWADRHKSLYYYYYDKQIKEDFSKYKNLLDKLTKTGIAELVMKNYLKLPLMMFLTINLKGCLILLLPEWLQTKIKLIRLKPDLPKFSQNQKVLENTDLTMIKDLIQNSQH